MVKHFINQNDGLLDLLRNGVEDKNRNAVKVLMKVVRDAVNRYSYDKEKIDDVCGECICRVIKNRKKYDPRLSEPIAWIQKVVEDAFTNQQSPYV